ncbi:DUF4124 domain-containing protein [Rheinheimera gaetbuli]
MKKLSYLLFFSAFSIQAQVYKCERNGVVEFSQFPCAAEAEQLDMRPIGTATPGSRGEFRQQVDALKRQGRFVEYQITSLEQQKQQQADELKAQLYKLRRSFPRAEELVALQQRIDRLEQQFDEKIAAEKTKLVGLKQKTNNLERQYAQN